MQVRLLYEYRLPFISETPLFAAFTRPYRTRLISSVIRPYQFQYSPASISNLKQARYLRRELYLETKDVKIEEREDEEGEKGRGTQRKGRQNAET